GHPEPRYDIAAGDGMYKSTDGGAHWHHAGLETTRHIGQIVIDPHDANTVLVAALGHIFGPSPDRGVYRTTDGGATWKKVLFVDNQTGAVDLAADPADPNIVFATTWTARNWPWLSYFTPIEGEGSAIWKSTDGGQTFKRLNGENWPEGKLGRIGIAAAHLANGATRIYADIDSEAHGGMYRSDDGGEHWQFVNKASAVSTWYMSRLTVQPNEPDTVWTIGQSLHKSTDAGKTFTIIKGSPGGDDYHHLWINPKYPNHMVTASDQGTVVTVDGGAHWSDWYNQPTGQFYHLAADNRFPYWIYSGQQDSGTVGIVSRSDYGAISFRDWHPVGGDERDYDIPDPEDSNIVYGSGLGSRISRWDARTGEVQNVSPWPVSAYGRRPTDLKYRYTWISPIAFSAHAPYALYAGAQILFRTTDKGQHWDIISPDLTGARQGTKNCEGDVLIANATACGYGVIYSIAPSPRTNDEIWIGTDNGLIQTTADGGKNWRNVTPSNIPKRSKIASLDVSALEPGTAYAAVDNHRQDDFHPIAVRTHDNGKTWTKITNGLPDGNFVAVVRADPVKKGLLYAGTDAGVYVSFNDGDAWQPLQRNLPVAWVRDLLVHGNDLIAATQGRAIWALDDVTPLRQMGPFLENDSTVARADAHLFAPAPAIRVRGSQNKDTPPPADTALGTNPPNGAIIDYTLAKPAKQVVIEIREKGTGSDGKPRVVRRFASDDNTPPIKAERYFAQAWTKPAAKPSTESGAHRFVWNLRWPRPKAVEYGYSIAAVWGENTPLTPEGMLALPGEYDVVLIVDGQESRQTLTVVPDPRIHATRAELEQAFVFYRDVEGELAKAWQIYGEVDAVHEQLEALHKNQAAAKAKDAFAAFEKKFAPFREGKGEGAPNVGTIAEALTSLATDVEGADAAPTDAQQKVFVEYRGRLGQAANLWNATRQNELAALNRRLVALGVTEIRVPSADEIHVGEPPEGKDLP
ncbi:MAG: WD40/YVTN/BNR-like repeat-containing protein, partial [Rhodanobacteraceae bacterium]